MIDRQYSVRAIVDRVGAIVERYAYDAYGRPLIRESASRGDMDNDGTVLNSLSGPYPMDRDRYDDAGVSIWDSRADLDDDGVVHNRDENFAQLALNWHPASSPTVAQAFSDVDNPYMFQGRPHFALFPDQGHREICIAQQHERWPCRPRCFA